MSLYGHLNYLESLYIVTVEKSDGISVRVAGSFTFRHSRLASSLSSLYKNYDIHMDIVKITGVLVLLSLMSVTLAITNNLHVCESKNKSSDCIKLVTIPVTINQQFNSTLCSFMRSTMLLCVCTRKRYGLTLDNSSMEILQSKDFTSM